MGGFFNLEKTKVKKERDNCFTCGLDKQGCHTPYMKATGEGKKGILFIAEAPGSKEDDMGIQLVGEAGQTLRMVTSEFGVDLDRDCRKINAVNCRPPKNRTPTDKEIDCCRRFVWEEINTFKPKVICLLGGPALESFFGHRHPEALGGITKWRGWTIPDRLTGAWVVPSNHPSYVNRYVKQKAIRTIFRQDILTAVSMLQEPFPKYKDEKEQVLIFHHDSEIIPALRGLLELDPPPLLAFDFETSGRKPHAAGHFIRCMSMCWSDNYSIAFEMPPKGSDLFGMIVRILGNPRIRKTAHNMKFEDAWASHILGAKVRNWWLDSMLAAHVLDNRYGVTGLKFQLYVQFGTPDYSSKIEQYTKADDKNANSFNKIEEAPLDELLTYCGIDSLGQRRLALKQAKELGWK